MSDIVQAKNKPRQEIQNVKNCEKEDEQKRYDRLGSLWNCMTANSLPGQLRFRNEEELGTPMESFPCL